MASNFEMVKAFHKHFGLATPDEVVHLTGPLSPELISTIDKRCLHLIEEMRELGQAIEQRDIVKVADALGDLAYLTYGLAVQLGLDLDAIFAEIHRTNMLKQRVQSDDHKFGIMKPLGWTSPDLDHVVLKTNPLPKYEP